MKIKKIVLTFFVLIFGLVNVFCQDNLNFKFACQNLSKNKNIRGEFELIQSVGEKKGENKTREICSFGNFTLSADDGIIWFTKKPIESVMCVTKSYVYQEMKGKGRKIDGSKNLTFEQMANVISAMFVGDFASIDGSFEIDFEVEKNSDSKNSSASKTSSASEKVAVRENIDGFKNATSWKAVLVPKDKSMALYIKVIEVTGVCKNDVAFIDSFKMVQYNGEQSLYLLKNQKVIDNLTTDEQQYFKK